MISFKVISNHSLVVTILNEFKEREYRGLPLVMDALIDNNYNLNVLIQIDSKIKEHNKKLIETYCQSTPYNYQINYLSSC